jgi:hypothetical protein
MWKSHRRINFYFSGTVGAIGDWIPRIYTEKL